MATTQNLRLEDLLQIPQPQLVEIFKSLECPPIAELDGEYTGYSPDGGDAELRALIQERMFNEDSPLGYWMGKAYQPTGDTTGEGYNVWRKASGEHRHLRFRTFLGESHIDGRPAIIMHYSAYRNDAAARDLIDEVRKISDGLYLGAGSFGADDGQRTEPGCFILTGPNRACVGVDDAAAETE